MTNLDSILKSRDITLPTKVHLIKARIVDTTKVAQVQGRISTCTKVGQGVCIELRQGKGS